jgi:hypothetical protein
MTEMRADGMAKAKDAFRSKKYLRPSAQLVDSKHFSE